MPSFSFLLYIILLLGAWALKQVYIGWFGSYFLAAVAVLPPLLLLLSLPSMLRLRARVEGPRLCRKGGEAGLSVRFQTGRLLPLGKVRLTLRLENLYTGEASEESYIFRGLLSGDCVIPLSTERCGLVRCRVAELACWDGLGLLRLRRPCPDGADCAILPQPVPPKEPPDIDAALHAGTVLKPKYGGGYAEEHDLRTYRPGDAVNSIHWKLSSKTDEVIVREPLVDANTQVYLILADPGEEQEGLATLLWLSLELCKLETAHALVGGEVCPVANETEAMEAMARLLSRPWTEPRPVDRAKARCVFVVSGGEVSVL